MENENSWLMPDDILEEFIRQYIQHQDHEEIVFTWQGGEPTLAGINFYEKVVQFENKHRGHKTIHNDLQTNGVLLNDEWCEFLKKNNFLVGLSIDGPEDINNHHRLTKAGDTVFKQVLNSISLLKKYAVPFNALVTVNRDNAKHPLVVYRYLRDVIQPRLIQFNPCVEVRDFDKKAPPYTFPDELINATTKSTNQEAFRSLVNEWTVEPDDYGSFLCEIFDEWHQNDIGKTFVLNFECAVAQQVGVYGYMCTFGEICGKGLAVEHNGSIYSCDHYVYPEYLLGNIMTRGLKDAILSPRQRRFGFDKKHELPKYCLECKYLYMCYGECPKNRFLKTPSGEDGLNYLCSGLKKFFSHTESRIKNIAKNLSQ